MNTLIDKIGRLMLVMLLVTAVACRQQKGQDGRQQGPPPMPTDAEIVEMVDELGEEISLDEMQKAEILKRYQAHFKEVESKMESGRPERKEMDALIGEFEDGVNALLTEEQQVMFKAYQQKTRKGGRR